MDIVKQILKHLSGKVSLFWFGNGKTMGSIVPIIEKEYSNQLLAIWTYGSIEIYFQYYKDKPPFNNMVKRKELLTRLNSLEGLNIPFDKIDKRPSFDLKLLQKGDNLQQFLTIYDWYLSEIELNQK